MNISYVCSPVKTLTVRLTDYDKGGNCRKAVFENSVYHPETEEDVATMDQLLLIKPKLRLLVKKVDKSAAEQAVLNHIQKQQNKALKHGLTSQGNVGDPVNPENLSMELQQLGASEADANDVAAGVEKSTKVSQFEKSNLQPDADVLAEEPVRSKTKKPLNIGKKSN